MLAIVKLGLLLFGRLYLVKQVEPILACNYYKDTLFAVGIMGLVYLAMFAM